MLERQAIYSSRAETSPRAWTWVDGHGKDQALCGGEAAEVAEEVSLLGRSSGELSWSSGTCARMRPEIDASVFAINQRLRNLSDDPPAGGIYVLCSTDLPCLVTKSETVRLRVITHAAPPGNPSACTLWCV